MEQPPDRPVAGRPFAVKAGPRLFSLGNRLAKCASMVRGGAALADVGTDHAYLPILLALRGKIKSAVASDIRPGPLVRAEKNVARYGVSGLVSVRRSDGLDEILPEEADDVVVAGMGGELIARIVGRAGWLKEPGRRLILQPMTSVPELRLFLAGEGFAVLREEAVSEGGHVYTVLLSSYDPDGVRADELYPYAGALDGSTEDGGCYLRRQASGLRKQARGLALTGRREEAGALERIADRLISLCGKEGKQ